MGRLRGSVELGRVVAARLRRENVTFMAGSIAYQAFVSLVPLLVLVVLFLSVGAGRRFAEEAVTAAGETLSPNVGPVVRAALRVDATAGASAIGVATLLWGSFRVFRGLDTAFSEIYGANANGGLLDQVVGGAVAIVALLSALVATGLAATAVAAVDLPYVGLAVPLLLVAGLVVAFFPIYWRFPDADVSMRATLPGVVVAAVGWAALQTVFELYASLAERLDAANVLGALLLLQVWLSLNSLVLLVGAVVNAVAADCGG